MRRTSILQIPAAAATWCALAVSFVANATEALPGDAGIVPKPVKLELGTGAFVLSPQCRILHQKGSPGSKAAAEYLADTWRNGTRLPFTYFDLSYTEDPAEPGLRWAGVISLEKAYSFDPKPADLPPAVAERIRGVEGCLWSETLVTPDRPDYMAYPRVCALAEVAWTPQNERSWPEFWNRLCQHHLGRLDAAGIAYRIPPPTVRQNGQQVTVLPPYEGAQVRCTLDGFEPGPTSKLYTQPFDLPKDAVLKTRTFRPNGRGSRTITGAELPRTGA